MLLLLKRRPPPACYYLFILLLSQHPPQLMPRSLVWMWMIALNLPLSDLLDILSQCMIDLCEHRCQEQVSFS